MLHVLTTETAQAAAETLTPLRPVGAVAAMIARRIRRAGAPPILYVAETARRMQDIAALVRLLAGEERVAAFVPLDGEPGDDIAPDVASLGLRMATLRWLCDRQRRPAVVVTTAPALLRRVPPRRIWADVHVELDVGDALDVRNLEERLARIGYRLDERVDEPGEAAVRGRVVEVFPAAAPRPCRIEHEAGRIVSIRSFDPATQRSVAASEHLIVDPATDRLPAGEATASTTLATHYGDLETVFDYLPDAELILEEGSARRAEEVFRALDEAPDSASAADDLLAPGEWAARLGGQLSAVVHEGETSAKVPPFAREAQPFEAFAEFAGPLAKEGWRIVVAGPGEAELRRAVRQAARAIGLRPAIARSWGAVVKAPADRLVAWRAPVAEGFVDAAERIAVVSLRDLVGQRAGLGPVLRADVFSKADELFGIGDAVVHFDHGVGILEGMETVSDGDGRTDALRLRYADGGSLLVPMAEIGALWRYGGAGTDVPLDRLKGETWRRKRDDMVGAVARTAEGMVARLRARNAARAPVLTPDRLDFERFCARFPFELTPDQALATEAVLADLESGRPMDRLLCGDVGFGKTEVALRAAAAAVFAGRQVAVVAPTTVLAQQHLLLFRKRFARHGIEVVRLSRLADAAETATAKAALADGSARIVVGSHGVLAKDVAFRDLALVVIDEEQRFGAAQKEGLRRLGQGLHVLAMSATPIPRTLQAGLVGLHEVSIVATPPARRRPVRTQAGPFDEETVRAALLAEKARGGQSFVVCPRIEDLAPMGERLQRLVPGLSVTMLHGALDPAELDAAMLAFSGGGGDVLLATNIVESGIDVPGANTMIVWRADRFGLSQLHQLRGRVGRGARRGLALLTTDPDAAPTPEAERRLEVLQRLTALGAGFAIAGRDLDLRGAGDLVGEEQAGHLRLIGVALYRRMLERALAVARGETPPEDRRPELSLGIVGAVPEDYVPEPDLRIELAVLLDGVRDELELLSLRQEIEDRFGTLPPELARGFSLEALRLRCRELGVRRLDAGPKAVAATLAPAEAAALRRRLGRRGKDLRWSKDRLILDRPSQEPDERLAAAGALLDRLD